jgi:hypothetical protein
MSSFNLTRTVAMHNTDIRVQELSSYSFEGQVVRITDNILVMTSIEGRECSYKCSENVNMVCNGRDYEAQKITYGRKIRVTTNINERNTIAEIEFIDKNAEFANFHDWATTTLLGT